MFDLHNIIWILVGSVILFLILRSGWPCFFSGHEWVYNEPTHGWKKCLYCHLMKEAEIE